MQQWTPRSPKPHILIPTGLILLVGSLTPPEQTLGALIRPVLIHESLTWTGQLFFIIAAITGLLHLTTDKGDYLG